MKTLYIVRHAKSSWKEMELSDHDRPLKDTGRKKTQKIVQYLLLKNVQADLMISSPAVRAYDTAVIVARGLAYPTQSIQTDDGLYEANTDYLNNLLLTKIDDSVNSLMLFGHNPVFTSFANQFLSHKITWLPTSGIASISFATKSWKNVMQAGKTTNFVIYPRIL